MATKPSHKRPHKFKHKKVGKKKHKTTKKISLGQQRQKEQEIQKPFITEGVVDQSGFSLQAQVQQETQQKEPFQQEPQPIIATSKENPPIQSESTQQTSGVSTTVSEEKPVQNVAITPSEVHDIPPPLQNSEPEHKKGKLWIILVFIIFLALVGGGLYYFRQEVLLKSVEKKEATPTPSEVSPPPKLEEEATSSAKLIKADPSEFSIKVLNGSGIAGEAARVRETLEEAGFVVEDIGNADSNDYTKTVIKAKEPVAKEYLDLLREELGKIYLLDENEELGEEKDTDVVVIVGKEEV